MWEALFRLDPSLDAAELSKELNRIKTFEEIFDYTVETRGRVPGVAPYFREVV